MGQFLYLVNRETLTLRIFVVMSLYCLSLMIPVWWLALPVNPVTNAWDIFPFIDSLKGILTSGRIVWWVVHGIIAAYFTSVYFDTMSYAYAFLLPLYAPFFWWCFLYAKTFWRGYGGDAPKLNLPPMLPRAVEGATFAPLDPVLPVEGEEPKVEEDEEEEHEDEEEEEEEEQEWEDAEGEEESVIPSPKVAVKRRRKPATVAAEKSERAQSPSSDDLAVAAKSPKRLPKSSSKTSPVKA